MNDDDLCYDQEIFGAKKTLAWSLVAIIIAIAICMTIVFAGVHFLMYLILATMAVLTITYVAMHCNRGRHSTNDMDDASSFFEEVVEI
ncbi:hypothetical protein LSTR_LSTR010680 [Laodelphax striatellus]|uniref:Uncharacterized protein n=1 Tax=Laodelphax striatellus TaxID=195883 RepID=A0A482WSH6_LAOST|nr:hypothetical protein LSTR_LSTR010680 [Laodelphax striatellus]